MQLLAHQLLDLIGEALLNAGPDSFARHSAQRRLARLRAELEPMRVEVTLPGRVEPSEAFFSDSPRQNEPEDESGPVVDVPKTLRQRKDKEV